MRLLIVTQKVDRDDDVLGFFHSWIEAFSQECERVEVMCLYKGQYNLPSNVKVHSLGKEKGASKLSYLFNFYKLIFELRYSYDAVFVHMNHHYVLLGWFMWKFFSKKVSLWYAHGHTPLLLHVAVWMSDILFSSTKSGLRINTEKLYVIGQGIPVDKFLRKKEVATPAFFKVVSIGRISPVKDYETLIEAIFLLKKSFPIVVEIYGKEGIGSDRLYKKKLEDFLRKKNLGDIVHFMGSMSHQEVPTLLQTADLFVNMSRTGSLDKAVLEAMAVGIPVVTPNEAFAEILGNLTDSLMYRKGDSVSLSQKIERMHDLSPLERDHIGQQLRQIVFKDHALKNFVVKIVKRLR